MPMAVDLKILLAHRFWAFCHFGHTRTCPAGQLLQRVYHPPSGGSRNRFTWPSSCVMVWLSHKSHHLNGHGLFECPHAGYSAWSFWRKSRYLLPTNSSSNLSLTLRCQARRLNSSESCPEPWCLVGDQLSAFVCECV